MREDSRLWYYEFVRKDIERLLPSYSAHVLEIGCGGGGTLAWMKETGRAGQISGIELSHEAAEIAAARLDRVYEGDVGDQVSKIEKASQDLVLCLDVLEHLVDPWQALQRIHELVKPGGRLIVSLPNIRHYSVIKSLLLGDWQYTEAGILDRTHLRFFTRSSSHALVQGAGFTVRSWLSNYAWGTWDKYKDAISFGVFNQFLTFQYLILAEKR